jgi:hypothetical protein
MSAGAARSILRFSYENRGAANMRRLFLLTGTLVLGLTALMCVTAPVSAQRGGGGGGRAGGGRVEGGRVEGHVEGGRVEARHVEARHVEAARAIARTGSIHFGARAGRDPLGPRDVPLGVHRNLYRGEYARHFRPGYRSLLLGGSEYYYYNDLPLSGCQTVLANGITYDLCDGVYYQPYIYGGQTVYLVAPM